MPEEQGSCTWGDGPAGLALAYFGSGAGTSGLPCPRMRVRLFLPPLPAVAATMAPEEQGAHQGVQLPQGQVLEQFYLV